MRSNTKKVLRFANATWVDSVSIWMTMSSMSPTYTTTQTPILINSVNTLRSKNLYHVHEWLWTRWTGEAIHQACNRCNWQTYTEECVFKFVSGFITVEIGLLHYGTRPYLSQRMRNVVIEQADNTHPSAQATKNTRNDELYVQIMWGRKRWLENRECLLWCAKNRSWAGKSSVLNSADAQLGERLHLVCAYIQEVGNCSASSRQQVYHPHRCRCWFWVDLIAPRKTLYNVCPLFGSFGIPHT